MLPLFLFLLLLLLFSLPLFVVLIIAILVALNVFVVLVFFTVGDVIFVVVLFFVVGVVVVVVNGDDFIVVAVAVVGSGGAVLLFFLLLLLLLSLLGSTYYEAIDCLVELGTIPTGSPKHLFAVLVSLTFYFSLGTSLIFHPFRYKYYKTRYISPCHSNLSKSLVTRTRFTF